MVWCKHSTSSFSKQLFKRTQCWIQTGLLKKQTKRNKNKYLFTDVNKVILATPNWSISFLFSSMIFMNWSCIAETEYPFCYFSVLLKLKQFHYRPRDILPFSWIETNASTETSISIAPTICFQGLFFCFKRQTHSIKCSLFRSDATFILPGICWSHKAWTFVFKCHKQPPRRALLIHFTGFQNAILYRKKKYTAVQHLNTLIWAFTCIYLILRHVEPFAFESRPKFPLKFNRYSKPAFWTEQTLKLSWLIRS